jgi:hypothetical protein
MEYTEYPFIHGFSYTSFPYGKRFKFTNCTYSIILEQNKFESISSNDFLGTNLPLHIRNNYFIVTDRH